MNGQVAVTLAEKVLSPPKQEVKVLDVDKVNPLEVALTGTLLLESMIAV